MIRIRKLIPVCALAALAGTGCSTVDEILEADNPAQIREDQLDDATLANVLVNSVTGALASMYADPLIWIGSMITDEQVSGINWEGTARVSQRILPYDGGDARGMWRNLSQYRFMADSVSGRLRKLLPDHAKDRRMALVLAHAGYSYTLIAETMCEAALNVEPKLYSSKEMAQLAITRFEESIAIATAAGASANDVRNLARTGLARAALLVGDNAKAMAAARDVPLDFVWWVEYKDNVSNNPLVGNVTGGNHNTGIHPRWLPGEFGTTLSNSVITDPRMQHRRDPRLGHNQLTKLYTPYQSLPYSKFNGQALATGGTPVLYDRDTDIKLASGLEAMHHYYEAAGPNGTGPRGSTLQFVNERRAFGKQAAVDLSGAELMSELRTQRFKDTWFGGLRLGDLRRYAAQGINDPLHTFPDGPHPNAEWGNYGSATCFPLPDIEYIGNPGLKRPGA